jgi:hypothetical protein
MGYNYRNADGKTQLNWGTIAKYSAIAVVVGAAVLIVYKRRK